MEKLYIVRYYGGAYASDYDKVVFATPKKSTATRYVTKFNRILKKWKEYYSQFECTICGIKWMKEGHSDKHYHRWNQLRDISRAYYQEIEVR
jgi:hypothetical protein